MISDPILLSQIFNVSFEFVFVLVFVFCGLFTGCHDMAIELLLTAFIIGIF